jgi:hypothetical protein
VTNAFDLSHCWCFLAQLKVTDIILLDAIVIFRLKWTCLRYIWICRAAIHSSRFGVRFLQQPTCCFDQHWGGKSLGLWSREAVQLISGMFFERYAHGQEEEEEEEAAWQRVIAWYRALARDVINNETWPIFGRFLTLFPLKRPVRRENKYLQYGGRPSMTSSRDVTASPLLDGRSHRY